MDNRQRILKQIEKIEDRLSSKITIKPGYNADAHKLSILYNKLDEL